MPVLFVCIHLFQLYTRHTWRLGELGRYLKSQGHTVPIVSQLSKRLVRIFREYTKIRKRTKQKTETNFQGIVNNDLTSMIQALLNKNCHAPC